MFFYLKRNYCFNKQNLKYNEDKLHVFYEFVQKQVVNFMYNSILECVDLDEAGKQLDDFVIKVLFKDKKQIKVKYNQRNIDRRSYYDKALLSVMRNVYKEKHTQRNHLFCRNERMHSNHFKINTDKQIIQIKVKGNLGDIILTSWIYNTVRRNVHGLENKFVNAWKGSKLLHYHRDSIFRNEDLIKEHEITKPFVVDENGLIVKLSMDGGSIEFNLTCEYWRKFQSGDRLYISQDMYVYLKLKKPQMNATPINIFLHTKPLYVWNIYLSQQLKRTLKHLLDKQINSND